MSKTQASGMEDSLDSGISTEKDSEDATTPSPKAFTLRRHNLSSKISFKSLTALNAKDSLEKLQKIRRRGGDGRDGGSKRGFFSRGSSGSEKRGRKKNKRKGCFDKSNVSEVNIRKVTSELDRCEEDRLVNVVNPRKLAAGKTTLTFPTTSSPVSSSPPPSDAPLDLQQSLEMLSLTEDEKPPVDYGSGDLSSLATAATCARILDEDSRRRSVQWKREVDVIYYAGDADGGRGRVIHRENEPLREESEQQARRNRLARLALSKSLVLSGACQLRDPWLMLMPKHLDLKTLKKRIL